MTTSRRALLTGALIGIGGGLTGAGYLVQTEVLPGRVALARTLGQDGDPGSIPAGPIGELRRGRFASPARGGRETGWAIAYPPGVDPDRPVTAGSARLPVAVVLPGRGDDAESMVSLGYPAFLAAAVRAGTAPFALAAVSGADAYWHHRADGDDPGTMVLTEWLPRLVETGLAARPQDRVGFLGWSMGGYGSLLLASRLGPDRVAAIAAESPALWLHPRDRAPGSFDSDADFRANDVFGRRAVLSRIPIRVDCGTADPFHRAARAFAGGLDPDPVSNFGAGDHSGGYWRARAPESIAFIGKHLTSG